MLLRLVLPSQSMDSTLAVLFDGSDDLQLVDAIAVAIPEPLSESSPEPQRVLSCVWHASGVIGNGGFEALFQADIDSAWVVKNLKAIGAHDSADAVVRALEVFPNSTPPSDWIERGEFIDGLGGDQEKMLQAAASEFFHDEKPRLARLGEYARSNSDSFKGLKAGWVAKDYVESLKSFPNLDSSSREVAEWIIGMVGHVRLPDLDGRVQFFNSTYKPLPTTEIVISEIGFPRHRSDTPTTLEHVSKLSAIQDSLDSVSFAGCDFSSDFVTHLTKLPQLRTLDLSETNTVDADLNGISKLTLTTISLSSTSISNESVEQLALIPTLQTVNLGRTKVSIDCIDHLRLLSNLTELELPQTLLTDANIPRLALLDSLKSLDLASGNVTILGLAHLRDMKNLESLVLDSCPITDAGLVSLAGMDNLKQLQLRYTEVTDVGLTHLESHSQLETLDLNSTKITDAGLASLSKLKNLETLELDSTKITDHGIRHLRSLQKLKSLSLFETAVGDLGMETIGKLTTLTDLGLSETQVTDSGISKLSGLQDLRRLSFIGTEVTDESIPTLSGFTEMWDMHTSGHISIEGKKKLKQTLKHWQ